MRPGSMVSMVAGTNDSRRRHAEADEVEHVATVYGYGWEALRQSIYPSSRRLGHGRAFARAATPVMSGRSGSAVQAVSEPSYTPTSWTPVSECPRDTGCRDPAAAIGDDRAPGFRSPAAESGTEFADREQPSSRRIDELATGKFTLAECARVAGGRRLPRWSSSPSTFPSSVPLVVHRLRDLVR